jgi:glutamine synthetase
VTDYHRIRVLWPDHLGLARGKYVPARLAENGAKFCTGVWSLGYDREMTPGTPGSNFFQGLSDMDAEFELADVRQSWEPDTGIVVADLFEHGEPVAVSPRTALTKAVSDWAELGYRVNIGLELEAYLLEPDGDGGWQPINTDGAYVYGTGAEVDPYGVIEEIWKIAEGIGLRIESFNSEYDNPQFELTLCYDEAMKAADDAFLFKLLAKEVATRYGLLLTFMGKPFSEKGGSGLHINLSLANPETGENLLLDGDAGDGLSKIAHQAIAGMVAHHEGLAGILAPNVNAYKRLQPGQLNGYFANWGYDHRCVVVRVSAERGTATRLEHRMADGAAGIHASIAAVMQAARLGVVNELPLPEAETGDGLEEANTEVCVPANLSLALEALNADAELVEALGPMLVDQHTVTRTTEWNRFCRATTDWELNEYLAFL